MSVSNPYVRYSYGDYRSLVASTDKRYELLDGEIVMVPSPTTGHQRVSRNLEFLLVTFVRAHRLGEVFDAPFDVVFGEGATREVAQPDLVFVSSERRSIITEHAIEGAPDLVVEILSPGSEAVDRGYKRALYARYGVAEYWIVDPKAKVIEVYGLGPSGFEPRGRYQPRHQFASPLFSDLRLPLEEVFRAE